MRVQIGRRASFNSMEVNESETYDFTENGIHHIATCKSSPSIFFPFVRCLWNRLSSNQTIDFFHMEKQVCRFWCCLFLTGRKRNLLNKIYRKKTWCRSIKRCLLPLFLPVFHVKLVCILLSFLFDRICTVICKTCLGAETRLNLPFLWNIRKDTLSAQGQRWFWSNIVKL